MRVVTGCAGKFVAQVFGMDRFIKLLFDQRRFLGMAIGARCCRILGIRRMWMLVVPFVMAAGARQLPMIGPFIGDWISQKTPQGLDIQTFLGRMRNSGFAVTGQTFVVGLADFLYLRRG